MNDIYKAVDILRHGGLVAFPTETVYGLGADATNIAAVQRIFAAKGRTPTNPLIVHIADAIIARRYAKSWPDIAEKLAEKFWPGPLTLVLPKADVIVPEVTAGRNTVGLRVPNHPLAVELLRAFGGPVAAPSANRSNHVSPTEAEHVRQELGDAVDQILDGGRCEVGIESTVLDLSGNHPTILRPGGITREQIATIIGEVEIFNGSVNPDVAAASPGQQPRHYSPITPAYRFESDQRDRMMEILGAATSPAAMVVLGPLPYKNSAKFRTIELPNDPLRYAHQLYATLRALDRQGFTALFIEMPPPAPPWLAVRDRLMRATQPIVGAIDRKGA